MLLARLGQLNAVLAQGAQIFGFGVADPPFTGHELCSADPYVQGPGDPAPLHPTAAGELAIALADQQALPQAQNLVPAPTASPGRDRLSASAGMISPLVGGQGLLLLVVHQVQRRTGRRRARPARASRSTCADAGPEQAEPVDDLVRHEVDRRVARPAVVGVVVALAGP